MVPRGGAETQKVVTDTNPYPNLEGVAKSAKPGGQKKSRKSGVFEKTVKNGDFTTFSGFLSPGGFRHF